MRSSAKITSTLSLLPTDRLSRGASPVDQLRGFASISALTSYVASSVAVSDPAPKAWEDDEEEDDEDFLDDDDDLDLGDEEDDDFLDDDDAEEVEEGEGEILEEE